MTEPIITDHALVRWLERAHGIEMEHFRSLLADAARPFAAVGAMHAEVGGVWLVFDGPKLVTVTPVKPKPPQTLRHDRGDANRSSRIQRHQPHWKHRRRRGGK